MMWFQYKPFLKRINRYFHAYGGWEAVTLSPLFLASLLISLGSYNRWSDLGWVSLSQSLIPSLLGFSLGTYSILFSLVTSRVKRAMKTKLGPSGLSRLEEVNASFFHFIFVQVVALTWAFIFSGDGITRLTVYLFSENDLALKVYDHVQTIGSFVGYLLILYSFLLILGAALAVYRLALITDPKEN